MTMSLHQPVMFVGLGGTGCRIGSELERRLRSELCGPDGQEMTRARENSNLLPYQLPSCLQFVYADIDREELEHAQKRSVPGQEHERAAAFTAHYSSELVPALDSYPQVAASLRLSAGPYVAPWLPPANGEPKIAPLNKGAGQLPTVGRAALFETLRSGMEAVHRDLVEAAGRLAKSGDDLHALGGRAPQSVDVFVAFSVAGGTGAGIFYDYLHLIGDVFARYTDLSVKIYPLVVMPSAFANGLGGGRPAQLNAGRALLDLFRLVDQQNGGDVDKTLRGSDPRSASEAVTLDLISVQYPGSTPIVLPPAQVQTGFLFSLPIGADRDDLHRSIVAFILSLVGQEFSNANHLSFARAFINAGATRETQASNGIGNRGVSTAQVASLTVPVDELGDLVAGRLLNHAINDLASPLGGTPEDNTTFFQTFFERSSIHTAVSRDQLQIVEPEPVSGAMQITAALRERVNSMKQSLEDLQFRLTHEMPQTVDGFDPATALRWLIGETDPFRTQRIMFGHTELPIDWQRQGVLGIMHNLKTAAPDEGIGSLPPNPPALKDKLVRRVRYADPEVVAALEQQNDWYTWRTRDVWAQAWSAQSNRWVRPMEQQQMRLRRFTDALRELARSDDELFRARADDLARARVGVSYLLPLRGGTLEDFYNRVVNSMIAQRSATTNLRAAATPTELLQNLLQGGRWRTHYEASLDADATRAVATLREFVKDEIVRFLQKPDQQDPILPPMESRLRLAAGLDYTSSEDPEVQDFKGKLTGLIPASFAPQGAGDMKVLITYPGTTPNGQIEAYLRHTLRLPTSTGDSKVVVEFRPVASESLSVVMFRHGMGVTEVKEVRDVLRTWSQALAREQSNDFLKWRQRTGYRFDYLATREDHRVTILHHLLCALWNGNVSVVGDEDSPTEISVTLGEIVMELPLRGLGNASSWADVVRAYELGALEDDRPLRRDFCKQLMAEIPADLDTLSSPPHPLYTRVTKMLQQQVAQLDSAIARLPKETQPRALQYKRFWTQTLPAAKQVSFLYDNPVCSNLEDLEAEYLGRSEP
jgi:hypothetical protein